MFLKISGLVVRNLINQLPMFSVLILAFFIVRLILMYNKNKKINIHRELIFFYFLVYIAIVYQIVTMQDISVGTSNFVPFREIMRYSFGSSLFMLNVVGNILMFIPFGFFITYLIKRSNFFLVFFLSLFTTATIEFSQLAVGRVVDIDDVILNMVGAILGYIIYHLARLIYPKLPSFLKKKVFIHVFIIIISLVVIDYYFMKF
jgi:glycopeptide antibiotics resistance protein